MTGTMQMSIEQYNAMAERMAYLEQKLAEMEWTPVSERLPEVGQDVMISVGGMYTAEGCLRADGDWWQFRWEAVQPKNMVTAWMPLPEPYKGVTE